VKLVLASRNAHKLREFQEILDGDVELLPLPDAVELPPETGTTFMENALVKAQTAARETGLPAIADDSGISAAALDGAPGVLSARFAGENASDRENLAKLLRMVGADDDRRVAYVCALAYAEPDGSEQRFEEYCRGTLAAEPRGSGGFGYDPVFVPDGEERTVGELGDEWKAQHSHRSRSARALRDAVDRGRLASS
jgi:XTP/dITP diphosphohydrolase